MKKLLLLICSLSLSFNAYGEWGEIGKTPMGDTIYINYDSIKKTNGYIYWWLMLDFAKPSGTGQKSVQVFSQGDCNISRVKSLRTVFYFEPYGKGAFELDDFVSDWYYPTPRSIDGQTLHKVCEYFNDSSDDDIEESNTQTNALKSAYIENIASRVKTYWRYQGANDNWFCTVRVLQDRDGTVYLTDVSECNTGNSPKAQSFKNSIERAVYKASPLPSAPDDSVFDKSIMFKFSVN
jgi:hypothetical protein